MIRTPWLTEDANMKIFKTAGEGLIFLVLLAGLSWMTKSIASEPQTGNTEPEIKIDFKTDKDTGQDQVRAAAELHRGEAAILGVIMEVTEYPRLHEWIQKVIQLDSTDDGRQEFLVEFKFPWPVGCKWSRIEVQQEGGKGISWRQIDGSLGMNEGRMSVLADGELSYIDYRASIDVGVSKALVRPYMKGFVTDFLAAIDRRAKQRKQQIAKTRLSVAD